MSIYGKSFSYNGKSSADFNAVLCSFDSNDVMKETSIKFVTNKGEITPNRDIANFYNKAYTDPLKFSVGLCKCHGESFSLTERDAIISWLTSPQNYSLFTVEDFEDAEPYHKDIEYFALCTSCKEFYPDGYIRGLAFEFECSAPYGFTPEETTSFVSTAAQPASFVLQNTSHELSKLYYPLITMTATATGEITITNDRITDKSFTIELRSGQTVTIDNQLGDITDNLGLFKLSTDTNRQWLALLPGKNIISVKGEASGKITCRYIRKVGI